MFRHISTAELALDPFDAVGNQWMLITAGNSGSLNTMTASWGGLGVIWNKNVATCYIRPQRYTLEFIDREEFFSLCFFPENFRPALTLCGRKSGRDCDKIAETGLTVVNDCSAPYFEQAEKVLICRKLYRQQLSPDCFIDSSIEKEYPGGDYHFMFIGEIVDCLVKE